MNALDLFLKVVLVAFYLAWGACFAALIYLVVVEVRLWRIGRRINAAGVLIEKNESRISEMEEIAEFLDSAAADANPELKEEKLKRFSELKREFNKDHVLISNILKGINVDQANVWKIWKKIQ
jgi:hypothetical protein